MLRLPRETHHEGSPQRLKIKITVWSINSTLGYLSERLEVKILKTYFHSHVQRDIIHSRQDIVSCPLTGDWKNKRQYPGSTMGSASRKGEALNIRQGGHDVWEMLHSVKL